MELRFDEAIELARLLRRQGRHDEAKAHYERILGDHPGHATVLFELGLVARAQGQLETATNHFEQSVNQDNTNVQTYVELAKVRLALGKFEASEDASRHALHLDAGRHDALICLGMALNALERFANAVEVFQAALRGRPNFGDGYALMGQAFNSHGKFDAAAKAYRRALQLDPANSNTMYNLANTYVEMGKTERAASIYRQALRRNPKMTLAHFGLALAKRFRRGDPRFDEMKALLDSEGLDESSRSLLLYSLGKAYDDIGAYDDAFAYMKQANEQRAREFPYDKNESAKHTDDIIEADRLMAPDLYADTTADTIPVFVVGLSRSGKTLVEDMLSSSKRVAAGREKGYLGQALEQITREELLPAYPHNLPNLSRFQLTEIGQRYHRKYAEFVANNETHIINTSPRYLQYVGTILRCLPNAKVVYCERDALDHALFMYFKRYQRIQSHSYALNDALHFIAESRRLMRYWVEAYGEDKILKIQYEDLVTAPRSTINSITGFLELRRLPAIVSKSVHGQEVGHWRNYSKHLIDAGCAVPDTLDRPSTSGGKHELPKRAAG